MKGKLGFTGVTTRGTVLTVMIRRIGSQATVFLRTAGGATVPSSRAPVRDHKIVEVATFGNVEYANPTKGEMSRIEKVLADYGRHVFRRLEGHGANAGQSSSMISTTLRGVTRATRVLDLSASSDIVCDNLMCYKVGELCLCKFSLALPKISHIEELRLRGNGMDRWPELWRIAGLRVLDVSENRLATIPREVAQLAHLEELHIRDNQLDALPEELAKLPLLRVLDVRKNRLSAVPPTLASIALLDRDDER